MAGMTVGMNLDNVVDYTPNWMFTDLMQSSRPWISHSYNTVTRAQDFNGGQFIPVEVDANGWPTRLATWTNAHGQLMQQRLGTLMFNSLEGEFPGGTYRVEWQGTGEVVFGMDARETSRGVTPEGRNYTLLSVTPGNAGIYLGINSLSPSDPIRDIHVWMPDYNGQSFAGQRWQPGANFSPFHPLYKERISEFGILRFMQPQETVTSDIRTWADRRDANDSRQSSGNGGPMANGMSLEHMVQLANELDADPWFNMPHMADDDFVRNFATYVRENLEPGLTAYVEWSNEIWNSAPGYEGYFWIADQIRLPENSGLTHWQFAGRETARDMNIWSEVFAGQSQRIVRVAAGQAATAWITERVLENMGGSFDAITIAPYFGPTDAQRATYSASTTVDQILNDMRGNIAFSAQMTLNHQRLADEYSALLGRDIQLVAYEGGAHLNGNGAPYQNALFEATKDPRMADITRDYLRMQNAAGMDAYVHYKLTDRDRATQYGLFGVLLAQDQPTSEAHIYRALLEAASGELFTSTPTIVTLNVADSTANEAGLATGALRVTRGGDLSQALTVSYGVSGTAAAGTDYVALSGTVAFPANENTAYITITPRDDATLESNETVIVTLQSGLGYTLIGATASTGSVSLVSDDRLANAPTISLVATDPNAAEAGRDPGVFTITRANGNVANALTVFMQYGQQTTQAADYDQITTSVAFAAGQTTATITIRPVDDTAVENRENIILTLSDAPQYVLGPNRTAQVDITDNDVAAPVVTPVVTIVATDANAGEAGTNPGTFTLTRTGALNNTLVVRYTAAGTATAGSDFSPLGGFAQFAWGQATTTITVTPFNDASYELVETLIVNLTDGATYDLGNPAAATINITSDDAAPVLPTISISATDSGAAEQNRDVATLTFARTGATTAALTVNYTLGGMATNGQDFERLMGSIVIPAGQSSATITVRPVDDTLREATETLIVALAPSANYNLAPATTATVTIVDNDDPRQQRQLPVLMVIANDHFYYQEYADPRRELEAAGVPVVVAAGRRELSTAHPNSGQGSGNGQVMPDIALADASAVNYSAILFVGGYGATQYQYAFPGTYTNPLYNGSAAIRTTVNNLINAFVAQDKFVAGVCHGVSVLAWARIGGQSPVQNRVVTTAHFNSPPSNIAAAGMYRWHSEVNGATVYTGGVLGNAAIRQDDVVVDGRFITGENFDSAALFGRTVAAYVRNRSAVATVNVTSPDSSAAEQNLDPATLLVTRSGVLDHAQVVRYETSGSAVNGVDYAALPGRLLFQPGQAQATINVVPIDDSSDEANKDLLFALLGDFSYGLGSQRTALLSILDND